MRSAPAGATIPALVLLVGVCGWLALHHAADAAWSVDNPERAAIFGPPSGTIAAANALRRVVASNGVVDSRARALAAEALRRAPLSSMPLIIGGFDAAGQGDLPRARRLMEAARARDPRAAMARTWLLNDYARTGEYARALAEAGPVMRFDDSTRPQVYALTVQMLSVPGGAEAVKATLAQDPDWRGAFMQALPALHPTTAALAALTDKLPPPRDAAAAALEARALRAAAEAQ